MKLMSVLLISAAAVPFCGPGNIVTPEPPPIVVPPSPDPGLLPPERDAEANWELAGLIGIGGIPSRTVVCATVNPTGTDNDSTAIQKAIDGCPEDQIVKLGAGTFNIQIQDHLINLNKGITLRGAGPGKTILTAKRGTNNTFNNLIVAGPVRWGNDPVGSQALTKDVAQGANFVEVANAADFKVGEVVLLDEASNAGWQPDRANPDNRKVWASADYRVVWKKHDPVGNGDDFQANQFPNQDGTAGCWFSRCDRPTNELKMVSKIEGNKVTFDDPVTISYRVGNKAQLSRFKQFTFKAGIEDLTLEKADSTSVNWRWCAYCWAKNVENKWLGGGGFNFTYGFRDQLEGVYTHSSLSPNPGGGGYNWNLSFASSEILIEDSISILNNKTMTVHSAGAGSVVAYNYMDMSYIDYNPGWVEVGINASHMVGPHHVLFEGNWGNNFDSDNTHGNSIYMTIFRNYLTGFRQPFTTLAGVQVDDTSGCCFPMRAAGAWAYSYWFSFIGNVLGTPGKMDKWNYDAKKHDWGFPDPAIWSLGITGAANENQLWQDPKVLETTIRDGNYDFLTNKQQWQREELTERLPNSLFLDKKPAFWGDTPWPWVDPYTGKTYTLPAKARFDEGKPCR